MEIGVLADIHSNHLALEVCLGKIREMGIRDILFLGDYITDCPYPRKTMELLYRAQEEFRCLFIRGNREDYILSHKYNVTDGWHRCSQSGSLLYTYEELSGSDLRFFEDMPIGMEVRNDGYPIFSACHASMFDNRKCFSPDRGDINEVIKEQATELMVCGHIHDPYEYSFGGKRIINPGSVTGPRANMLVLSSDGGDWSAEHFTLDYDVRTMIDEFTESGLLEMGNAWSRGIIATLQGKGDVDLELVKLVNEKCKEKNLPIDAEDIWQEAAEELGI